MPYSDSVLSDRYPSDITLQTFLKQDQPADTSVSVLKWMDPFKPYMELQDIQQRFRRLLFLTASFRFFRILWNPPRPSGKNRPRHTAAGAVIPYAPL